MPLATFSETMKAWLQSFRNAMGSRTADVAEARVVHAAAYAYEPPHPLVNTISQALRRAGDWLERAEGWKIAALVFLTLILLPLTPALLILAAMAGFFLFVRAWFREIHILMRLPDDAFPGVNDKLIWGMLLILIPPAGVWLFSNFRAARWPEAKPTSHASYDARDWF